MMKLKNNIIAVLGLSLLLSLMSSGSTAQPQRRFFADTGINFLKVDGNEKEK